MNNEKAVRFARWVFLLAGIIGVVELVPLYFMENLIGLKQPPPITHPGFYYGFLGVAVSWQVAFLIISRDPVRYQALMPALFLEKLLYPLGMFTLFLSGRAPAQNLQTAVLDLVWLALFITVWVKLRR